MLPIDFLQHAVLDLPKSRNEDFIPFMKRLYTDYMKLVNALNPATLLGRTLRSKLPLIEAVCRLLMDAVERSIAHDHDGAYAKLEEALMQLGPHFDALCPKGDMSELVNPMYRFRRVAVADPTPDRTGLFHIGFEFPDRIGAMRYSVKGLPCLYLGGSTHVCWKELDEIDLNTVVVSRYSAIPSSNLRVLNFGHRMPVLAAYVATEPNRFKDNTGDIAFVAAQVACWPLIAISSIRVPDRNAADKPEYAIPQLVLEWITKNRGFHGIRFFSTRYTTYMDNPRTYMSYVFPAMTTSAAGHCPRLIDLFELTEPKKWCDAKKLPPSICARPIYKIRDQIQMPLENEFGYVEDALFGLPLDRLS